MPTIAFMDTNLHQHTRRGPRGPYRRHSIEFKRAIVEQSLQPGLSVSRLARRHDINANQIFAWRKAYREGRLEEAKFVPVVIHEAEVPGTNRVPDNVPPVASGRLIIECKEARLSVEGRPDAQALAQVLAVLLR